MTRTDSLLRATGLAVVGAAVAAALTHLLFQALGADMVVEPPGQPRTTVPFWQSALVAGLLTAVGGGVAALLARYVRRPTLVFTVLVVVVLLVFAVNPVRAADQALTIVALEVEHLVVAAVALALLLPVLQRRAAR